MKIEKLDYGYGKKKVKIAFLCGFILCAFVLILINYYVSKAAYRKTESVQLANGTVNYSLVDFEVVEIKIDDKPSGTMPTGNYKLLDTSYCTTKNSQNTDEKDSNIKLTYENGILNVTPYTKKGTKCHLYFSKISGESTLVDLNLKKDGTLGDYVTGPSCNDSTKCCNENNVNENGLYETEDDDGKSYIFRGTVDNNWVKFGKLKNSSNDIWWRILRINGDGTIRLIYSGVGSSAPSNNGSNVLNGQAYNGTAGDNTYVGFYYGSTGGNDFKLTHSNSTPSNIASQTNNWFSNTTNLNETAQLKHIDENAGFCNNRQISKVPQEWYVNEGTENRGTGQIFTVYKGWYNMYQKNNQLRVDVNYASLKCSSSVDNFEENEDYKRDYYTWKGHAIRGNQALVYPVGLITLDEVLLAGGFAGNPNSGYWLYTGQHYWTMSPDSAINARVFFVSINGYPEHEYVSSTNVGARPVINLKADTKFTFSGTGDKGTKENPYIVSD